MFGIDENTEFYIKEHIDREPAVLSALYRDTQLHQLYPRMCCDHYQGRLLKMLTSMINPARVLELGTFTGYSTLSIAEGLRKGAVVETIEIDDEKEDDLRQTFLTSGLGDRIKLHIGDALELIPQLEGPWQMVYIDANKRHYLQYFEAVLPKVPTGGFILADNTLWDMKVVDDKGIRDAQTAAVALFNDSIAADPRVEKVILPVRDGLTIMRKVS